MCIAPTAGEAEDIATRIEIDFDPLPVVHDMLEGRRPGAPLVHEAWGDNLFLTTDIDVAFAAIKAKAAKAVVRELRTARQVMSPLEGRGVVAWHDRRLDQLVVVSATQQPHIVRSGLAECLGIEEGRIRVISPDVGGGFGYKGVLLGEEVALAWAALKLGHPLRWIEDRRENLTAGANCREHHYRLTAYADRDGRLLGLDCEATVDAGAYSAYPFSACLEAGQIGSILPGLYDFPHYRCRTYSVATNKPPILPYRGVARTGVCFALEVTLDALARDLGIEPAELRMRSLVRPEQMPFDNIAKRHFDSGDYPQALQQAVDAIGRDALRERQRRGEPDGRRLGVGIAMYSEQAGHGTSVYAAWGIPFVPGHEPCHARFTPDGGLELRIGAHSHGQGLETTLSQVAHSILGVPHDRIKLVHGDTALTPYSTGTWGSRCAIMSGGAVAEACEQLAARVKRIGATLLQARPDDVALDRRHGRRRARPHLRRRDRAHLVPAAAGPSRRRRSRRARGHRRLQGEARHRDVQLRRARGGGPRRPRDRRARHSRLRRGRGRRRAPQSDDRRRPDRRRRRPGHRHRALRGDALRRATGSRRRRRSPTISSPARPTFPSVRIFHMETPSPYTRFGQKGLGEGGAIAPPAAITNAINDALKDLGAELLVSPVTPDRIVAAITARNRNALDAVGRAKACLAPSPRDSPHTCTRAVLIRHHFESHCEKRQPALVCAHIFAGPPCASAANIRALVLRPHVAGIG